VRPCLHKHDDYCDVTTYGDFAKYKAVLLCIQCGGQRLISREPVEEWPRNT
jgi:hypothetical protein